MKNLSSCLQGGCEIFTFGETRREVSAFALPLPSVVTVQTLTFSLDDCFAAAANSFCRAPPCGVAAAAALPPMTVLLFRYRRSFHFRSRFEVADMKPSPVADDFVADLDNRDIGFRHSRFS